MIAVAARAGVNHSKRLHFSAGCGAEENPGSVGTWVWGGDTICWEKPESLCVSSSQREG